MILILSQPNDSLVYNVCRWLDIKRKNYIIIDDNDKFILDELRIENNSFWFSLTSSESNKKIISSKISSYWYRRGKLNILKPNVNSATFSNKYILEYLNKDVNVIKYLILKCFESLPSIGSYFYELSSANNKLFNLYLASQLGIMIPNKTIITSNIRKFKEYVGNENFISKAISEFSYFNMTDNIEISAGTHKINMELVNSVKQIGYSFLQSELKKKYDIRVVYFFDKIFSAILCSQDCTTSQTDSRFENGGYRICNIEFSQETKKSLSRLMRKLKYNFVSLDFVWTIDNKLVFLEINPNGQVGAYNILAGWGLYKEIAIKLTEFEGYDQ